MNRGWIAAASLLLAFGCASTRQKAAPVCNEYGAYARGQRDGLASRNLEMSYLNSCPLMIREVLRASYRSGFEVSRAAVKRNRDLEKQLPAEEEMEEEASVQPTAEELARLAPARDPASPSWICEVEASSKIFTGMGITREEALSSARSSCGSHLQASSCQNADCKQSL